MTNREKKEVVIFGGTKEGRELAEYCIAVKLPAAVSVASYYGKDLLPENLQLEIQEGPMDEETMSKWLAEKGPDFVLDATHPYAVHVTENIKACCSRLSLPYYRVVRENGRICEENSMIWAKDVKEGARIVEGLKGNVLVTTGSKELEAFLAVTDFENRIYARVLPSPSVVEKCVSLGLKGNHIIAVQGPFSEEFNKALMKQLHINVLVTKEAGAAGGFEEKIEAAQAVGAVTVVIGRPKEEAGISLNQAKSMLDEKGKAKGEQPEAVKSLALIGIGMGGRGQMTLESISALKDSQVVFGAARMLKSVNPYIENKETAPIYDSKKIMEWLELHPECRKAAVVFSGDTGYYSGARQITETAGSQWQIEVYPGISTLSYMAAKLKKSWEDVKSASCHGRECNLEELMKTEKKLFLLTSGGENGNQVMRRLSEIEKKQAVSYFVAAGENLSYENEKIITGRPCQLEKEEFPALTAFWIEKEELSSGGENL